MVMVVRLVQSRRLLTALRTLGGAFTWLTVGNMLVALVTVTARLPFSPKLPMFILMSAGVGAAVFQLIGDAKQRRLCAFLSPALGAFFHSIWICLHLTRPALGLPLVFIWPTIMGLSGLGGGLFVHWIRSRQKRIDRLPGLPWFW